MIELLKVELLTDYPIFSGWWKKRGLKMPPEQCFLPAEGWMARNGIPLAASWLYTVPSARGGIGVIEFTVSNPDAEFADRTLGIAKIYERLEDIARLRGCGSVLSFVVPEKGGEKTFVEKLGYKDIGDGPHRTFGKALWQ